MHGKPSFRGIRVVLLCAALVCSCALARAQTPVPKSSAPTLYERVNARLAADTALARRLASPPPELSEARWMIGAWDVTARVFPANGKAGVATQGQAETRLALGDRWLVSEDHYPDGGVDIGY